MGSLIQIPLPQTASSLFVRWGTKEEAKYTHSRETWRTRHARVAPKIRRFPRVTCDSQSNRPVTFLPRWSFSATRKLNSSLFRFLHRSVFFKYKSTVTLKEIKLYRFTAPKELYLSGDVYPPNKGFCVPQCLPSGCLNVSLCQPQSKCMLTFVSYSISKTRTRTLFHGF